MDTGMEGKFVVVTGANSGIGKATATELLRRGADIIITARNEEKGKAALADICREGGRDAATLLLADFSRLSDVTKLADDILARTEKIDVLINNAGIMLSDRIMTADGFESTLQINHLAPFLLTARLGDLLGKGARVVNLSSDGHQMVRTFDFDDPLFERKWDGLKAYCQSKLANVLFTKELAKREKDKGVSSFAVHPGVVRTGFAQDGDAKGWFKWGVKLLSPVMLTPEKGAQTSIYCATAPGLESRSGWYFKKSRPAKPSAGARDEGAAVRLWEKSEQWLANWL